MNYVLNEYSKAWQAENIPQNIKERFCYHDCELTEFTVSKMLSCSSTLGED